MNKIKITKDNNKPKGFALLFSVLVASLVLAVGASVISVALKQTILSGSSRDSQFAFYAANTGVECARYWDLNNQAFPTSTGYIAPSDVYCEGEDILDSAVPAEFEIVDSGVDSATSKFKLIFSEAPYCAEITVSKSKQDGKIVTNIDSRGYNTCDLSNPRRVERGLNMTYEN